MNRKLTVIMVGLGICLILAFWISALVLSAFGQVIAPKVTVTGKCGQKNGGAFHITGSGFTLNGEVMMITFYPESSRYHGKFYSFFKNYGVYQASSTGTVKEKPWDCLYGADNQPDPVGTYKLIGLDISSDKTAPTQYFTITAK